MIQIVYSVGIHNTIIQSVLTVLTQDSNILSICGFKSHSKSDLVEYQYEIMLALVYLLIYNRYTEK